MAEKELKISSDSDDSEHILLTESTLDHVDNSVVDDERNEDDIIRDLTEQVKTRHILMNKNHALQQKLALFISISTEKDHFLEQDSGKATISDLTKMLDHISGKEDELLYASNKSLAEIELLKEELKQKRETLKELKTSFKEIAELAALKSVNSETGECFSIKDVKKLLKREEEASETLEEYQLQSVQTRHNLNLVRKKKTNLAEGPLDFAKYEMMCIETQNNKEIIQPLSEEIKNITKKATNIINVLSHLGQKLYLAQKEKTKALDMQKQLEIELNEMRDLLFEEKMAYATRTHESKELQHKFILLQYPRLIEDYNTVQQKNEEAQKELQRLKAIYEEEIKILKSKRKL